MCRYAIEICTIYTIEGTERGGERREKRLRGGEGGERKGREKGGRGERKRGEGREGGARERG